MANLMLSVMGAFAEFERALIRERQREGIALAKQRGAYQGPQKGACARAGSPTAQSRCSRREEGTACPRTRHQPGNCSSIPENG